MAAIYLLRHGRASFGADDYDRLDPLGIDQARHLGRALVRCGLRAPLFVSGSLRRHEETLRSCQAEMGIDAGFDTDARWNEFDHQQIISAAFPAFGSAAQLRTAIAQEPDPQAAFQRLFDTAIRRWAGGAHDADYAESWTAFRRRVRDALDALAGALQEGQDAVVSTSGGPIAAVVQQLLAVPDAHALRLNWVIVNASYTKLFSGHRLRLASFNVHAHLEQSRPGLVTYR